MEFSQQYAQKGAVKKLTVFLQPLLCDYTGFFIGLKFTSLSEYARRSNTNANAKAQITSMMLCCFKVTVARHTETRNTNEHTFIHGIFFEIAERERAMCADIVSST